MKNPGKTLIYLFLTFHLLHFIGALYIDSRQDDLSFLLSMKGYISWMKYFALSGLVLFISAYFIVTRDARILTKSLENSKEEQTALKAKLFDLQEEAGQTTSQPAQTQPERSEDLTEDADDKGSVG